MIFGGYIQYKKMTILREHRMRATITKDLHPPKIPRQYGALTPDGIRAASVSVWRHCSREDARGTRCPYGGLPVEGMESCLQTMHMRHLDWLPAWRKSSR